LGRIELSFSDESAILPLLQRMIFEKNFSAIVFPLKDAGLIAYVRNLSSKRGLMDKSS